MSTHIETIRSLVRFSCLTSLGQIRFCRVKLLMEIAFIFKILGFSKLWIRDWGPVQLKKEFQILYSFLQNCYWKCHFSHSPSDTKYVTILKYKCRSPYSSQSLIINHIIPKISVSTENSTSNKYFSTNLKWKIVYIKNTSEKRTSSFQSNHLATKVYLWTTNTGTTWEHIRNAEFWAFPIPTESDSSLKQDPQVLHLYIYTEES